MKISIFLATVALVSQLHAADTTTATNAINAFGIDLLAKTGKPGESTLLSPYSIECALAMTYAGADGETRIQMAKALHFPKDGTTLDQSFAALQKELLEVETSTAKIVAGSKRHGGASEPVTIAIANRLYGQEGFDFRKTYLDLVKQNYGAPLQEVNFEKEAGKATKTINDWVEKQTHNRIQNLIPDGALSDQTRLVLVNAIYLKAPWQSEFHEAGTKPAPFKTAGGKSINVPTMNNQDNFGYAKHEGYTAVSLPYVGSELQFLILLPDDAKGLPALESKLTPALLADCANLPQTELIIHLPKFKMTPPTIPLSSKLESMGIKNAFNIPKGSANFDGIAPRKPDSYLYISEVFHKTFLSLDENGTEAAAATAVVMMYGAGMALEQTKPVEVRVDHPFLFAIQHKKSGACLFLGRMNDPR